MNIAYVLAVATLDHAALVDQFSPVRIDSDDVWALIPRITAHHEPAFDAQGAIGRGQTHLTVRFTDGSLLESSRFAAASALEPIANGAIVDKYRRLTHGVLDQRRQQMIERLVLGLDQIDDLSELIEVLARPVASPFES